MDTILYDFRSDTVTRPSATMRNIMAQAEVGDDVFGDDPSVNQLEETAARILGKEAALFVPSGTQSNLVAILTHCQPGDEYLTGQDAHVFKYEGGGAAIVGGVTAQPIDFEEDGTLDLDKLATYIKPNDFHHTRTRLLCLENTNANRVLSVQYLARAADFAHAYNLAVHLDGARLFNAAIAAKVNVADMAQYADSVTICLSKGLGAPVGSLLCGRTDFIVRARRWRKVLGGGMRQAGILAAAGLYALTHNVARLHEDHENAAFLANQLRTLTAIEVLPYSAITNMVFVRDPQKNGIARMQELATFLQQRNILIAPSNPLRIVIHLDVPRIACERLAQAMMDFFA